MSFSSGPVLGKALRLQRAGVQARARAATELRGTSVALARFVEPAWLVALAAVWLISAAATFIAIVYDLLAGHPQKMKVMDWVWPITALYFGPIALWTYIRIGRRMVRGTSGDSNEKPFWQTTLVATTHCGAGCTLGDIIAEWAIFVVGFRIAGMFLWPEFIFDYVAAFALGIVFQYFSIVPMRHLPPGKGVVAALKADTLSLTAFEVGLFGWMALMRFVFFRHAHLHPDRAVYWFMMQVGMLIGFATAYPVNWWLVKSGLKEAM